MRLIRAALLLAVLPLTARAQDAEQKAVLAVVDKLFDGMRKADTASMRALFIPSARMLGVNPQGQPSSDSIDRWLAGIGRKPATTIYDEQTWAPEVRVDGTIAQAWMQYAFFIGERLNHCGVDAFDFLKIGGEWKIATVMDTRHMNACTPPPRKLP
jgi:hypothetical protein